MPPVELPARSASPSRRWRGLPLACWAGLASCSGQAPPAQPSGSVTLGAGVVEAIMRERGVGREQAIELGAEDALLAQHLVATEPSVAHWIERVVLARQLLAALGEEARAAGPPTGAEITELSQARFWELDRPRMVKVTHAVVVSRDERAEARALAERVASATAGARTAREFEARARAVPRGKLELRVESLPPVTEDGRAVDPARPPPAGPGVQQFDRSFAAAAHRLQRPGEQSPVVRTPFGYHVLYLASVIEPRQPTLDERQALLHDEIMDSRARALSQGLIERQRRELAPQQERSALDAMQAVGARR